MSPLVITALVPALPVLLILGCSQPHQSNLGSTLPVSASPSKSVDGSAIGTWQWITVDGDPAPFEFYVRLYSDGNAATWPTPFGEPTRGAYSLENGRFLIGDGGPSCAIEIRGDTMTLVTDDNNKLVYRRLMADLEPGTLRDGPDPFQEPPNE